MIRIIIVSIMVLSLVLGGCASSGVLLKRSQLLMGTLVWVSAVAPTEPDAQHAMTAGLQEIQRLEQILSTWIPDSELSRVNASAGQRPLQVSSETFEVLEQSMKMNRLTNGRLNIAIGPAVEVWNVSRERQIPTQDVLDTVRPLTRLDHLQLDQDSRAVFLAKPGMRLDIGGIGKGYAADRATMVMKQAGATAGVVAISGDIKTFGRMPDGERFVFGIQHPRKDGALLGWLELEDEAVSTAGDYQRYFIKEGIRYHHILDPQTLRPARLSQSVTVIAQEGVVADGLDTGIFVMGPEQGMALIERLDDVEGVIVGEDGDVFLSSGLRGRLRLE